MSEPAVSRKTRMMDATTARKSTRPGRLFLLAILMLGLHGAVSGCRHSGPPRYHLAGRVTFRETPVPAGRVQFLPDTSRGNHGPAGFAAIENGAYDTRQKGRGTVGGPHLVVIVGYDGKPVSNHGEVTPGAPLFPDYRATIDLPCRTDNRDFAIPSPQ